VGGLVIRTGVIGLSEGNGHPFSFSAIINGYEEDSFSKSGWPVINDYLKKKPDSRAGINGVSVTHAWTQRKEDTERLAEACRIVNVCQDIKDMVGEVDAVIIGRDDWVTHFDLAMPFLRAGVSVFVDKPLTLDAGELREFLPFMEAGQLMSCSGLRFAQELSSFRESRMATGELRLIAGTVLNGLDRYGIHLIEAVASLGGDFAHLHSISRLHASHDSFLIKFRTGIPFRLDCLGNVQKTFHLSFFGDQGHVHFDLHDNFNAFRVTLQHFFTMVKSKTPVIDPAETRRIMRLLSAGNTLNPGETFYLDDAS
jgi:hypothetical protein